MAKVLFITYDGLTDPLGQSQILPYLISLSLTGHDIIILSCEKKDRFKYHGQEIRELCQENKIEWVPLSFHTWPPVLSKIFDLYHLSFFATRICKRKRIQIIHARSYISARIALKLKVKFGIKFLFDMRGFWVDERVDGGIWDLSKFTHKCFYAYWKQEEHKLISCADYIVSLTEAAKTEMKSWRCWNNVPTSVIPCSVDTSIFVKRTSALMREARLELNLSSSDFVVSYLGSLGTWYLLDEMLEFFVTLRDFFPNLKFLIITPDINKVDTKKIEEFGLRQADFIIRYVRRIDIPRLLAAADISLSFIKPSYSKIASSPTKLGELLSMNIPVIANSVGDVNQVLKNTRGGILIRDFSRPSYEDAINWVIKNVDSNFSNDQGVIYNYFGLENAVREYNRIYNYLVY